MQHFIRFGFVSLFISFQLFAAEAVTGPVVEDYGPVFAVPEGSFNLNPESQYKVLMDIAKGPDDPSARNRYIESAARFLNMHSRNGIKPENLEFALVLHGTGIHAALKNEAYNNQFKVPNPNEKMIKALHDAGVKIYICGQSAAYRGYSTTELLAETSMAVSAMTVHVRLQQEGYQGILF